MKTIYNIPVWRVGADWRMFGSRVGIDPERLSYWESCELECPMGRVLAQWGDSPSATVRMLHRHLMSPQLRCTILGKRVADFYDVDWPSNALGLTSKWPWTGLHMALDGPLIDLELIYKWPWTDLQMTLDWPLNSIALTFKWPSTYLQLTLDWPLNDLGLTFKWTWGIKDAAVLKVNTKRCRVFDGR